jgi:predicted DNA-binding antitoxin AbrB/MazE fold protein
MESGSTQFDAVFENGVLRPLTPVALPQHARVSVTVSQPVDPLSDILDWDAHELAGLEADEHISLEEVQRALAGIPGSMAQTVSSERDER